MGSLSGLMGILNPYFNMVIAALILVLILLVVVYQYFLIRERFAEPSGASQLVEEALPETQRKSEVKETLSSLESSSDSEASSISSASSDLSRLNLHIRKIRQTVRNSELPDDVQDYHHNIFEAGKNAMEAGRLEQARGFFEEHLKISPHEAKTHLFLAIACYELGDLEAAETHSNHASSIDPFASSAFRKHLAFRI